MSFKVAAACFAMLLAPSLAVAWSFEYPFATPSLTSATIRIDSTNNPKPFNHKLIGVNFNGGSLAMNDPRMVHLLKEIKLPQVRFPGGTVGNCYDWEMDMNDPGSFCKDRTFFFNDYAANMRATGASSMLTFNVLTDSIQKSVARLANRTAAGLTIDYIEMGNENYAETQGGGRLNGSDPLIFKAFTKKLSAALKKELPGVQTAVPMTPWKGYEPGSWNSVLAAASYYDAVTMHPYVGGSGITDKASAEMALKASLKVKQHIDTYKQHFGSKPLLLTEWGVGAAAPNGQYLSAFAEADVFISQIFPNGRHGLLQQASKHVLIGGRVNTPCGLFAPDETGTVVATPSGVWYRKFASMLRTATDTLWTSVDNAAELDEGLETISAASFVGGDGHVRVLAVNRMNVTAQVTVKLDGKFTGMSVSTFHLSDPLGWQGFKLEEDPWVKKSVQNDATALLPPLSIAVLYLWDAPQVVHV